MIGYSIPIVVDAKCVFRVALSTGSPLWKNHFWHNLWRQTHYRLWKKNWHQNTLQIVKKYIIPHKRCLQVSRWRIIAKNTLWVERWASVQLGYTAVQNLCSPNIYWECKTTGWGTCSDGAGDSTNTCSQHQRHSHFGRSRICVTFLAGAKKHTPDSGQTDCADESGASCTWTAQGSFG